MNGWILVAIGVILVVGISGIVMYAAWPFVEDDSEQSAAQTATLIEALKVPGKTAWQSAVDDLVARGPAVVPYLIDALDDDHRAVREGVAHALGDLGPAAEAAVPALIGRVKADDDDFVRWKAVRALGFIGPAARDAIPMLQIIVEHETELLQASAQAAIARIEGREP